MPVTTSKELAAFYYVGSSITLLSSLFVITSYIKFKACRQHPSSLIFWRSISDVLFSLQFIVLFSNPDGRFHCDIFSFLFQFSVLASQSWYFMNGVDLVRSLRNPFTDATGNIYMYHLYVWSVSAVTSVAIVATRHAEYRPDMQLCWTSVSSTYFNYLNWITFFIPTLFYYFFSLIAIAYAKARLAKGLEKTFEQRKQALDNGVRYVAGFCAYWTFAGIIYGIIMLQGQSTSKDPDSGTDPNIHLPLYATFAVTIAFRGVVDAVIWARNQQVFLVYAKWFRGEPHETPADLGMQEHINKALRQEVLIFSTTGIALAVRKARRAHELSHHLPPPTMFPISLKQDDPRNMHSIVPIKVRRQDYLRSLNHAFSPTNHAVNSPSSSSSKGGSGVGSPKPPSTSNTSRATSVPQSYAGSSPSPLVGAGSNDLSAGLLKEAIPPAGMVENEITLDVSYDNLDGEYGTNGGGMTKTSTATTTTTLSTAGSTGSSQGNSGDPSSATTGFLGRDLEESSAASTSTSTSLNSVDFLDYAPQVFRFLRSKYGVSDEEYVRSIQGSTEAMVEKFTEGGRSGAFFYFSEDSRYIVKTLTSGECEALLRFLPKYAAHMDRYPSSLLSRLCGFHALKLYNLTIHFIVMQSVFLTPRTIHERYDLKGSWVDRHAATGGPEDQRARRTPAGKRHQIESSSSSSSSGARGAGIFARKGGVYKDNDLNRAVRIGKVDRNMLLKQLTLDAHFLRDCNIMDYSLLLGVHHTSHKVPVLSPMPGSSAHSDPLSPLHYTPPGSNSSPSSSSYGSSSSDVPPRGVFQRADGGIQAAVIEGPGLYFFGLIDILQEYNTSKKLERFAKVYLRFKDGAGISSIAPAPYADRFLRAIRSITATDDANDDEYSNQGRLDDEHDVTANPIEESRLNEMRYQGSPSPLGAVAPATSSPSPPPPPTTTTVAAGAGADADHRSSMPRTISRMSPLNTDDGEFGQL